MKKKVSAKVFGIALSAAVCLSAFSSPIYAVDGIVNNNASTSSSIRTELSLNTTPIENRTVNFDNDQIFAEINDVDSMYIYSDPIVSDLNTATAFNSISSVNLVNDTENSAPIAGLTAIVANPDSLINGGITTNTVIYWLWDDGGELYTYDPDGDDLSYHLDGDISDYYLGGVTLGGETVGFATQFTLAAEHEFGFWATDSYGNDSNKLDINVKSEPSDGSSRPICVIGTSNISNIIPQNAYVAFNWTSSYDPDATGSVNYARVYVRHNDYEELVNSSSDYYADSNGRGMKLTFPYTGTYDVRIVVIDNTGAWSNWNTTTLTVQSSSELGNTNSIITQLEFVTSDGSNWEDQKLLSSYASGNTTVRKVLYSRLSEAHVYVYEYKDCVYLDTYTNHNGTYYDVIAYNVAPGTLFMSSDITTPNGPHIYTDPVRGLTTPRYLDSQDMAYLSNYGNYSQLAGSLGKDKIIYDPVSHTVVDFYTNFNPIIYNNSGVSYTISTLN